MKAPFLFISMILLISCNAPDSIDKEKEMEAIINTLSQQQKDWNNGDIDAFMQGYMNSEELMFIGSGGIQQGWDSTIDRYKKSYPTKEKMGDLTFDIIKVDILDQQHAHVVGKYTLRDNRDSIFSSGYYTLLWKKINDTWLIALDQTCG